MFSRWTHYNLDAGGTQGGTMVAPDSAPAITPIQQAIADARATIANGGSIAGTTAQPDAGSITPPAAEPARNPDGTFAATTPPADPVAPATEGEANAEGDTGEAPAGDPLVIALPGRREGDPDVLLTAPDAESAERLRQVLNGYQRGEVLRAESARIAQDRESLSMIEARLEFDPEGFLFDNVPQDRAASVALQVLLQPEVWNEASSILEELLADETRRELVRVSLENQRLTNRDKAQSQMAQRAETAKNVTAVKQTIARLIPEHLPEDRQSALYQACQADIAAYADRMGLNMLDPQDVPLVVAQRLREYGVDPVQAAANLAARGAGRLTESSPAGKPAPRVMARAAAPAQPTGKQFVEAAKLAARAGAVPPAGAGAASAAANPPAPAGQSIDERISWARQNLKFG